MWDDDFRLHFAHRYVRLGSNDESSQATWIHSHYRARSVAQGSISLHLSVTVICVSVLTHAYVAVCWKYDGQADWTGPRSPGTVTFSSQIWKSRRRVEITQGSGGLEPQKGPEHKQTQWWALPCPSIIRARVTQQSHSYCRMKHKHSFTTADCIFKFKVDPSAIIT
jgi:hypothetical protein